jgi:adenylosuccinate synthase
MNGDIVDHMPDNIDDLATVTAVVEMMPGWKTSTREADSWDALPEAASNYLNRLSELVEAPIGIVSIGPGREHTFFVDR